MDLPGPGQLPLALVVAAKGSYKPNESQIELAICHYLRIKGYFFYKNPTRGYFSGKVSNDGRGRKVMVGSFRKDHNPYTLCGGPDLVLIHRGLYVGLEVKSETGRQSEAQKEFQRLLEASGGKYFIVRSIEDVENALKGINYGK